MQTFELKLYFTYAIAIIRQNTIIIWALAVIGMINALVLLTKDTSAFWFLNSISMFLSIAATPVIYGIYYELIEDTYSSVGAITRTYLLPYLWLLLRMYVPVIFLAVVATMLLPGQGGYLEINLIVFSLIYIYVIPVYYMTGRQSGAIARGVQLLFSHLSGSTPILLSVLLLETSMLLVSKSKVGLLDLPVLLFAGIDCLVYIVASLADFTIFIMLIFIVRQIETAPPNEEELHR